MEQKAVLTLKEEEGTVRIKLAFEPEIRADDSENVVGHLCVIAMRAITDEMKRLNS